MIRRHRILVIGRNGQLAQALAATDWPNLSNVQFAGRAEIDLFRPVQLRQQISTLSPEIIINAQTHVKNNYMRNPLASEVFNEAVCSLLKQKIRASLRRTDEVTIAFDYDGEVSLPDTLGILDQAQELHQRVLAACDHARSEQRRIALNVFAASLARTFYDFEPDFFQQNLSRIVDDEIGIIRSSLELWPTLLEIVYYQRHCHSLPMRRVKNQERPTGKSAAATKAA